MLHYFVPILQAARVAGGGGGKRFGHTDPLANSRIKMASRLSIGIEVSASA